MLQGFCKILYKACIQDKFWNVINIHSRITPAHTEDSWYCSFASNPKHTDYTITLPPTIFMQISTNSHKQL